MVAIDVSIPSIPLDDGCSKHRESNDKDGDGGEVNHDIGLLAG